MALPSTRNTNYASGSSPFKAADMNAIQDCIVGNKKPSMTRAFFASGIVPSAPAGLNINIGIGGTQNYIVSTAAPTFLVIVPTEVGDRVTGLRANAFGDGAADCTYTVQVLDLTQAGTNLASATDTNRAAAWGEFNITAFTAHTMAVGELLAVYVAINAANYRIGNWRLTYDRL